MLVKSNPKNYKEKLPYHHNKKFRIIAYSVRFLSGQKMHN